MQSLLRMLLLVSLGAVTAEAQNKSGSYTIPVPLYESGPPPKADAAATAKPIGKEELKALLEGKSFTNSVGMDLVKISDNLWVGKYLVTQEEYQKVTGGNPSQFAGNRNPVDSVSWNDTLAFCRKLTEVEAKAEMLPEGFSYSLPTQSQWESLVAGAVLKDAVTSLDASRSSSAPVGSLGANSLGLYDIRGNLWEWCLDPQDQAYRVLRGASWRTSYEVNARVEFRYYEPPDSKMNIFGFRCVLVPGGK